MSRFWSHIFQAGVKYHRFHNGFPPLWIRYSPSTNLEVDNVLLEPVLVDTPTKIKRNTTKMMLWKMYHLSNTAILGIQVKFQRGYIGISFHSSGCSYYLRATAGTRFLSPWTRLPATRFFLRICKVQGIGKDVPRAQRTPSWEIPYYKPYISL